MATRKKVTSRRPTHTVEISHQTQLNFRVDDKHVRAIQQCLKNGELKITVSKVDLEAGGRFKNGYLYD